MTITNINIWCELALSAVSIKLLVYYKLRILFIIVTAHSDAILFILFVCIIYDFPRTSKSNAIKVRTNASVSLPIKRRFLSPP